MTQHLALLVLVVLGTFLLAAAVYFARRATHARLRTVSATAAAFLASAALLRTFFWLLDLDVESHAAILWAWIAATAVVIGFAAGVLTRRMPGADLFLAVLIATDVAGVAMGLTVDHLDIASPYLRILIVAPFAFFFGSTFSASLAYLLFAGGKLDFRLGYEVIVGRQFLLSRSSSVLSTVTTISVVGVALGVWLVTIALGVLAGFEGDLQDKIIGANAHIVLKNERDEPLVLPDGALERIRAIDGIAAAAPYVEGEVALASQSNYSGCSVFGIAPELAPQVLEVFAHMETGSLEGLINEMRPTPPRPEQEEGEEFAPPAPLPGIVIGREMSKNLNVTVGDRIRMISPLLETMTPIGSAIPKSRGFRVEGIFSIEMYEFDARYAYVSLKAARQFLELDSNQVGGVQVRADEPGRTAALGDLAVAAVAGAGDPVPGLEALDWQQRNQTLFSALKLERVVAFIVLVFIILVASFSIVNTLTMSVIEKKREIAILMTMGAREVGVMKLFLVQGMLVGVFGTVIGAVAAVLTATALQHIGFGIPGDVYYITSLPVRVGVGDVVLIALAALLIVWDFAVFPALRGSRLEPVEGLRDG